MSLAEWPKLHKPSSGRRSCLSTVHLRRNVADLILRGLTLDLTQRFVAGGIYGMHSIAITTRQQIKADGCNPPGERVMFRVKPFFF